MPRKKPEKPVRSKSVLKREAIQMGEPERWTGTAPGPASAPGAYTREIPR